MNRQKIWIGVDLGTSAVKCMAVDGSGAVVCVEREAYAPLHTEGSRVEQAPGEWWEAACAALRRCTARLGGEIDAVSFSGQMSALVLLDEAGRPVRRAMLIADARADRQAADLERAYGERFRQRTGNRPIEAFAAAKLLWLAQEEPQTLAQAACLLFAKDYLRFCLCGDRATDPTDAGNSLLLDLGSGDWDWPLIAALGLPARLFPPLRPSDAVCGAVSEAAARQTGLAAGTPVVTGAADMACSQLGADALTPARIAVTLSTSAQVVRATPTRPRAWQDRLTYHPAVQPGRLYAMASVFSGGLAFDWAARLLCGGTDFATLDCELTAFHAEIGPSPVLFLPFLTGSGSPRFDSADRGAFCGMTPATGARELLAAVMEGVCFCIRENVELLEAEGTAELVLAGGGSRMAVWGQLLCEILGRPVRLLSHRDTSVWGAARLAARDAGREFHNPVAGSYEPDARRAAQYGAQYARYRALSEAVNAAAHQTDNLQPRFLSN